MEKVKIVLLEAVDNMTSKLFILNSINRAATISCLISLYYFFGFHSFAVQPITLKSTSRPTSLTWS